MRKVLYAATCVALAATGTAWASTSPNTSTNTPDPENTKWYSYFGALHICAPSLGPPGSIVAAEQQQGIDPDIERDQDSDGNLSEVVLRFPNTDVPGAKVVLYYFTTSQACESFAKDQVDPNADLN